MLFIPVFHSHSDEILALTVVNCNRAVMNDSYLTEACLLYQSCTTAAACIAVVSPDCMLTAFCHDPTSSDICSYEASKCK